MKIKIMRENIIEAKSFNFALQSIQIYKLLIRQNEYVLSKQFLRSSTSIGANVREASAGYSKKDFAAKMSIASKEARESLYWIQLIETSTFIDFDFKKIKEESETLIRILTSIVKTSQINLKNQ
jgi:four helix bundle protein